MEIDDLQKLVNENALKNFGKTPLKERLDDILKETLEICRYTDLNNLREETGDALWSLLQLCNESGWDASELVQETCNKITRREQQYKSLGRKYKIALLGGAFNPITKGHIETAQYVLNTSGQFDEVWLTPPIKHMHNKEMASFEDRLNMCKLAAECDGRIKVFDYEKRKNLAGETYHFLKTLLSDPDYENYNFSFIIGLDNANTFDTWVNYEELERLIRFVVVPRVGYEPISGLWYFNFPHIFLNGKGEKIPIMDISSTEVRKKMKEYYAASFKGLVEDELSKAVDKKVLNYIIEHRLYEDNR